ncbi:MAG: aldose 1-epimerase family protein [Chloroflexota bacterium]
MKAHGQQLTRHELARRSGDPAALGGVRSVILDDGSERGVRVVEFRTGSGLAFDVLVDRAMDIGAAEHAGLSFGWRSPTGFRHPSLHEYADEDGLSWLRSFSGLLVTAGLDHTGGVAEIDASHFQYPARKTVRNGLHGRVSNIPARLIGAGEIWNGDECVLWAEGEVKQVAVFAEHLRLRRRIEADLGGDEIRLLDTVTNYGFDRTPHMYLYHINFGWPLLDEGTRVVAPIKRTRRYTDSVQKQRVSYQRMPGPLYPFVEQVYSHEVVADANGQVTAALVNDAREIAVSVTWSLEQFPYFAEWLHLREGGYTIGFEPTTRFGRAGSPEASPPIWLEHGDSRTYETTFRVTRGREGIATLVDGIRAIARQPEEDVPPID